MVVSTNEIQDLCDQVNQQVRRVYEDISLYFLVHEAGRLRDAIALAENDFESHPAGEAAQHILKKQPKNERSAFLGLSISSQTKMLGLKRVENLLAVFTVNASEFDELRETKAKIYQLTWHALDLYDLRKNPKYKGQFLSGPMIPKRTPMNLSKSNLQADAFACLMLAMQGDRSLADMLGEKRAKQSLSPITNFKAEDYPSLIAMEATEIAIEEMVKAPPPKEEQFIYAKRLSVEIGQAFDKASIKQWWDYSVPAQDMAWRGFESEEILSAALNTSDSPFVRSMAYLVSERCDIHPVDSEKLKKAYNAFLDPDKTIDLHRELMDATFEEAITKSINENSNRAFLEVANQQNQTLTEGRILGWCAIAMQSAGKAFERALRDGIAPEQAARLDYSNNKGDDSWDDLKELSEKIIDKKRQGVAITMGHVAEICNTDPKFAPILESMKMTMNDPEYVQKLEAVSDLSIMPSAPSLNNAPQAAPKGPAPKGPAPQAPVMGPAIGGGAGARAAQIARHNQMMQQQKQDADKNTSDKETSDK
ncbi:MAG: hypothetical protein AAF549_03560 [Pseudomonadota bacterium]